MAKEEKKSKIFEKLKKPLGKISLGRKKKRRLIFPEEETPSPIKLKLISILSKLKQILISAKDMILFFLGDMKSILMGFKNAIVNFFSFIIKLPRVTAGKIPQFTGMTKKFLNIVILETKLFIKRKKKQLEESPPFIQKHIVNVKPVEKSLIVTAKKSTVFYWIRDEAKRIGKKLPVEIMDKERRIRKLKEDILEGLDSQPLSQTIIKCIELARLTGRYSDIKWMERELNGYGKVDSFVKVGRDYPEYRQTKAILQMSWYIKGEYSLTNEILNIPFFCVKPVHWIEEIIDRCKKTRAKEVVMKLPIPEGLSMFKGYLKKDIIDVLTPVSSLEFVLNGIKIRIHEFMFKIAAEQVKKRRETKHLKK